MRHLPRAAILLLFGAQLIGCPAGKLYREGQRFEEANQDVRAAETYLDALDLKPAQKRSNKALAAMAESAWNQLHRVAAEREAAGSYPEALISYQRLLTLTQRLDQHDLLTFPTIDVAERVEAMANAAADERYRFGEAAVASGRWAGAVKGYSEALSFKADYKDSTQKLAFSYYNWGAASVASGAWREGAERYASAEQTVPRYQDAAAQAARIYAALGRDFKERGACRSAVRDLRASLRYAADPKVEADLGASLSCATSRVAVDVFGNPTHVSPGGLAVGDVLSEKLIAAIPRGASEFVRAEAYTSAGARGLSAWPGPAYGLSGKLVQVRVTSPEPVERRRETTVDQRVPCAPGDGEPGSLCLVPARIAYVERSLNPSVSLEISLTLTDLHSGATVSTDKVTATAADDVSWAEGLTLGGRPAPVAQGDDDLGLVLPDELIERLNAPRQVRGPDTLARAALDQAASAIASKLRPVVDAEAPAADPVALKLP